MTNKIVEEDLKIIADDLGHYSTKLNSKTILITGGGGFIGRYLVALVDFLNRTVLEKPCKVIVLDNFITGVKNPILDYDGIKSINHDVRNPLKLEESIDFIIHAAGIASPFYYTKYPIETIEVGTIGTKNMLELAREKSVKGFLFLSSSEIYGDPDPKFVPTAETYFGNVNCIGSRSCYDESKRLGETLCMTYYNLFKIPVNIVRPFNIYGPGIKPDDFRVLPNFIHNALNGNFLPVYGEGNHKRAFCYITDAITAIYKILLSDLNGEVFNIGNQSEEISIIDLANLVAEIFDNKVGIKKISSPSEAYASDDPKRRCPDLTKIKNLLGYNAKIDLRIGIKRTVQWFKQEYGYA